MPSSTLTACGLALALALGARAGAETAAPLSPSPLPGTAPAPSMRVGWTDAYVGAAGALFFLGAQLRYAGMPAADSSALRRSDLLPFDRPFAGRYSRGADLASTALVVPLCAAPAALSALEAWRGKSGWGAAASDMTVFAEALTFSSALDLYVRSLRVHPRPYVYGDAAPLKDRNAGEASGSFYSGHASAAFLAATYLACTYPRRHPGFTGEAWLWAGGLAAAAGVAALRVEAGKHFPSDVAVGAATGALFGWLFPRLHTGAADASPALRAQSDALGAHALVEMHF